MKRRIVHVLMSMLVLALVAGGVAAWVLWPAERPTQAQDRPRRAVPVVLTPAREMTFEESLALSGNVEAKTTALVSARIPGTLEEVYVDEGDRVEAGKTDLFRTDSLKLTKAVEVARQETAVAESSVRERLAGLEELQADHEQNTTDVRRYERLHERGAATDHELEIQKSRQKQSAARIKHAEALVDLARAQLEQARSGLTMAQKDLADSLVNSPINGRVSERFREPGEMASAGTAVLKIEDLSVIEISALLPEEYYPRVHVGKTPMRIRVVGTDLGEHAISYRSPTIHATLRTFEIKCVLHDPPKHVVSGAIAEVGVVFAQRKGVGVPVSALETRAKGPVVFVSAGPTVRKVPIRKGLETNGFVEIRDAKIAAGAIIVTMGQNFLEDGDEVQVVEEDN